MPIATPAPPHPHLPVPLGVLSPWQHSTRSHPLLNSHIDDPLPSEADVVIIGSGMCGAVVAHTLLTAQDRPQKVVVLEAREICSGASGRNAGHCRPDAARGFTHFAALHGEEQAIKIMESENVVIDRVHKFVTTHGIECEWTPRTTYDVCLSHEFRKYEGEALANMRSAGGNPAIEVLDAPAGKAVSNTDVAVGAYGWQAATLNPAKLTLAIHSRNVDMGGYELYAYAPVHSVKEADSSVPGQTGWTVTTPRGSVRANKVVFATNAYSQALVPELAGLIIPWRAQGIKIPPAPAGPEACPRFEPSYSLRFLPKHFYSVATRPDNTIVLGTSREWAGMTPSISATMQDTVDDSHANPDVTQNGMETFCKLYPQGNWSVEGTASGATNRQEEPLQYAWTGIIGMTPDAVPFIGPVPGKSGQYVAAGYNGHGMARIFLCAPALAKYVLTDSWDSEMPEAFRITSDRLEKLRTMVSENKLARDGGDTTKLVV